MVDGVRRAANENVPITTRRVSEGTQCINGWSLAHASPWFILIRRTPNDCEGGPGIADPSTVASYKCSVNFPVL